MTAFAQAPALLMRRLRAPAIPTRWICAASSENPGRGAWDLQRPAERNNPNRDRRPENARSPGRPAREGYDQRSRPPRERTQGWDRRSDNNSRPDRARRYDREPAYDTDGGYDRDTFRPSQRTPSRDPRRDRQRMGSFRRASDDDDYLGSPRFRDEGGRRAPSRFNDDEGYGRAFSPPRNDDAPHAQSQWSGRRAERATPYQEGREEPSVVQRALAAVDDDLLYGVTPILLALTAGRRTRFEKLYVQSGKRNGVGSEGMAGPSRKADNDVALEKILTLATGKGITITYLDKGDLNMLSRNRPHQGVVLQTSQLEYEDLKELPKVEADTLNSRGVPPCYLVLDEVTDPQNAGALMRSAHFLGADGVIACRRNSCRLTPVVSKASAGALEVMRVRGVASMPRFLRAARENGWRVVGTALSEEAVRAKSISLDRPTLVVLGSEGHGLRTMVRQACEVLVRIEGVPSVVDEAVGFQPVDSLNVSVAGAVALYQLLGR